MSETKETSSGTIVYIRYTPELGQRICDEISDGKSLPEVCAMAGMPSQRSVFSWVRSNPEFERLYRSAQQDRAEGWVEEIMTIADDASGDYSVDAEGNRHFNAEHYQRSRLKVDTRKWFACKVIPKLYGDKVAIGGAADLPPIQTADVSEEEIARRIAFALAKGLNPPQETTP